MQLSKGVSGHHWPARCPRTNPVGLLSSPQLTWQTAREEPADIGATLRALDERVGVGPWFGHTHACWVRSPAPLLLHTLLNGPYRTRVGGALKAPPALVVAPGPACVC